ncbi:TonB-dependent receptor domain-containing protein [Candidatus Igneacidithiobacillus taiwanensis]|uniref:TonB-dependent receptor n=2 Tax=Candidatus Igneacidithiobacillus taiwanensis TaxID=1945924 RepID=UPI0028998320|nr:TonB-dependent receptor [Candidatus Igneacidithiobacillus taiwanensis]
MTYYGSIYAIDLGAANLVTLDMERIMKASKPLSLSVSAALLFLTQTAAHADTQSLGTVTGTASSGSTGFFGATPKVNVGHTPASDIQQVQKFDKTATNQETTITKGQFDMLTPTDSYTQALNNLPNAMVVSSGDSMDGDDVYINGFSKSLINFTLDGIPLNDNDSYTYYTNEFIPSVLVANAKYYPGAESAALPGLAAFGGAFATNSLQPSPFPMVRPIVGGGSFGKYNYGGLINTGLFAKNVAPTSAWIYMNKIQRDGYFQNNGAIQTQFLFKSVTHVGPGDLTLFFTQNNQRFNYYNGATPTQIAQFGQDYNSYTSNLYNPNGTINTNYTGFNYNNYLNWLGYAKYEGQLGAVHFSDQLYYYYGNGFGAGATTFNTTLLTPAGTIISANPRNYGGALLRQSVNLTHRWGNIARLLFPLGPVDTEVGFWFNHNNTLHAANYYSLANTYVGANYYEPVVTDTYEPYLVFNYKPIDALRLTAGVKYLYAERSFVDDVALARKLPGQFNVNFSSVLPSVGANLRILPNWHAYFNYTENSNPPGYNQFYTGTYNPNLKPQSAKTYTFGTNWEVGPWTSQLQAFRVDFSKEDLI